MRLNGYLIFHLNLAFSSIEADKRSDVVRKCYHPLLDLIESTGVPIGIELTGWTLRKIYELDKSWVDRFKILLNKGDCELVGSGYSQIIGPLVPARVNKINQSLGLNAYNDILNIKPRLALVNEMAFSESLIDIYSQLGYGGLIMDRDNIRLAIDDVNFPNKAVSPSGSVLPVLWSDSILFQKLQHFAHGDISLGNYLEYVQSRIDNEESLFSIYCNDAEVFDYRPGRFGEERPTHSEGEWKRIAHLLKALADQKGIKFVSPSEALAVTMREEQVTGKLVSARYPIPVKKQAKYNISRWSVTGRNDLWLNTMCHRLERKLTSSNNQSESAWMKLCELWASDLRTHITEQRWNNAQSEIENLLLEYGIESTFNKLVSDEVNFIDAGKAAGKHEGAEISFCDEHLILKVATEHVEIELNLRRGLAIRKLAFKAHNMSPCLGTIPHGHFSSIALGADFYSGGTIIELPIQRSRFTDLEPVKPKISLSRDGVVQIRAEIEMGLGYLVKTIEVSMWTGAISLIYDFPRWDSILGSARLGILTFLNEFTSDDAVLATHNGGDDLEVFYLRGEVNHIKAASTFVSSSRGLGGTAGHIRLTAKELGLNLRWNPDQCAAMPMLYRTEENGIVLSRLLFSVKETDDTAKVPSPIAGFRLDIDSQ